MKLEAFLWDLDGVLVDTGAAHLPILGRHIGRDMGLRLTPEMFRSVFGMNNDLTINTLFGRSLTRSELDEISHKKESLFRAEMHGKIQLLPGVSDVVTFNSATVDPSSSRFIRSDREYRSSIG